MGDALKVPFAAEHQDQPVEVLAVLQRTAIVHAAGAAVWFQRRRKAAFSIGQRKSRGEAGQR